MIIANIIKAFVLFFLLIPTAWSEESHPLTLNKVLIGAYPMVLQQFNYADHTFDINFYLWTISKDPEFDPGKSLEITNAIHYEIKNQTKGKNPDGTIFNTLHVYSTNHHLWDVANFPFDRQLLKVEIEDALDINRILFISDKVESTLPPDFKIPGWEIENFYITVSDNTYITNFGNSSTTKGVYSKFTIFFDIKRQGARLFINYFIGFIISFLLATMIFSMRPDRVDSRVNLSLGSIFPAVGNKYVIDNFLPPTNMFTLSDAIQIIVFGMILVANVSTIITCKLVDNGHYVRALKANKYMQIISIPFFISIFIFFLLKALLS